MRNKILLLTFIVISFFTFIEISFSQDGKTNPENNSISLQDTTLAKEYIDKGDSLGIAGQYDSSAFYLHKSKEIYDWLSKQYDLQNIWAGLVKSSDKLGWNLILDGKYDAAMDQLSFALDIGLKKFGEEHSLITRVYNDIGVLYYVKRDYDNALNTLQKSLVIRLKLFGEDDIGVATIIFNIGNIYNDKGDYYKSLEYYQKSLSIKLRLFGEVDYDVGANYNNIGNSYLKLEDYEKALDCFQKSISIYLKIVGEEHILVIQSYSNIGQVYEYKGDFVKALENYNKSLSLSVKMGDIASNYKFMEGTAYKNIGNIYLKKGDYDQALNSYLKSLSVKLKIDASVYNDYQSIAEIYYNKKDFVTALEYCQKSITSNVSGFKDQSVYSNPPLIGISSELDLLNTLKLKAKILTEKTAIKDIEMALSTYQLAVELIDKIRTGYKSEGSKLFLGEQTSEVYDQAIQTSLKLYNITKEDKYKQQAFLFAEKTKAAVLQGGLAEVQAIQFAKLTSTLLEEEKQLKIDLAFYETQLQNEFIKNESADSTKISEYQDQLFGLKTKYEELISSFEKNYPDYYNLKYQTRTISVREIQNQMQENTTLLEYFVGDSVIYIFTVSKDKFDILSIKKPVNFSEIVKDFYSSILKTETKKYIISANDLSKLLILPVTNKISAEKNLVIIPHNLLYKIPFEALFTSSQSKDRNDYSKFDYLIKTFDVSYHYSSTLYINSLKERVDIFAEKGSEPEKNFIGFAPIFAKNDLTGYTLASKDLAILSADSDELFRSAIIDGKRFDELKYSEWEVKSIIELFASQPRRNLINQVPASLAYFYSDATEEAFKSNINNYNIVHIASHSFINETHPQISGIVFAQPVPIETGRNLINQVPTSINQVPAVDDGILYAGETYNLDLNADLVVLSSCESGLGKLIRGEGLMALTRGFLYAGADNIIFSLWKIPDKHTSELMIEFYKQMLSVKSYSQSLRQAKLSLIENQITARPRSWASFILIGSN